VSPRIHLHADLDAWHDSFENTNPTRPQQLCTRRQKRNYGLRILLTNNLLFLSTLLFQPPVFLVHGNLLVICLLRKRKVIVHNLSLVRTSRPRFLPVFASERLPLGACTRSLSSCLHGKPSNWLISAEAAHYQVSGPISRLDYALCFVSVVIPLSQMYVPLSLSAWGSLVCRDDLVQFFKFVKMSESSYHC
jgi:hypothetical protein